MPAAKGHSCDRTLAIALVGLAALLALAQWAVVWRRGARPEPDALALAMPTYTPRPTRDLAPPPEAEEAYPPPQQPEAPASRPSWIDEAYPAPEAPQALREPEPPAEQDAAYPGPAESEPTPTVGEAPPPEREATPTPRPTFTPAIEATPTPRPPLATPTPDREAATPTPRPPLEEAANGEEQATAAPTATAIVTGLLDRVTVDNGTWGEGYVLIEHQSHQPLYVEDGEGRRYRAEMGFLEHPDALATVQRYWEMAGRGSANWSMLVVIRESVGWVSCPEERLVCYEHEVHSGRSVVTSEVYLRPAVWHSLLDDYLRGGVEATTRNAHYGAIQEAIYDPMCGHVPTSATIGFRFEPVN